LCGAAVAWAWRRYLPWRGPRLVAGSCLVGVAAGALGAAGWIVALEPWAPAAGAWTPVAWALRAAAATLIVPLVEEQLMRGYVLRLGTQWGETKDFDEAFEKRSVFDIPAGRVNAVGVALSTALFAAGHAMVEWPAAIGYGLLMCLLYAWRKDLLTVVVAHATTNLALALYVRQTGAWGLWG
jgi:membrane protease YdiL (CAAX protease family)